MLDYYIQSRYTIYWFSFEFKVLKIYKLYKIIIKDSKQFCMFLLLKRCAGGNIHYEKTIS